VAKSIRLTIDQAISVAEKEVKQGNFSKALQLYKRVLQQHPNHSEAKKGLRKLHKEFPWDQPTQDKSMPPSQDQLNTLIKLFNSNQVIKVEQDCRKLLQHYSESIIVLNILGLVLHKQGKLEKAVQSFDKALQIKPDFVEAHCNRGNTLQEQGKLREAVESFSKAIQIKPDFVEAYYNRSNALKQQHRLQEAVQSLDKAIQLKPNFAEAHSNRGIVLQVQGRLQEATESFNKAIQIKPDFAEAYYNLSKIKRHDEYDETIRDMESLYDREDTSSKQRELLAFALGKAFEELKEYDKAFKYILEGNQLKRSSYHYEIKSDVERFNKMKEVFSPAFFSSHSKMGNPDETPIFILGMPRSGTTLVEQILASHSQVHGAGELLDLFMVASGIHTAKTKDKFPECLTGLTDENFVALGSSYLKSLRKHSNSKRFITDKMPHNFRLIGLIKVILPKAKVIHCMRHPMDNCLSVFKNRFSRANHYAYNLRDLGQFYYHYLDLMNHWRNTIPNFIYDISYEALVSDQEKQTRKLLNHCQLPWEESCLSFHKTERPIATSSYIQVRRPMYRDSINLWMKYEKQLESLKKVFNQ